MRSIRPLAMTGLVFLFLAEGQRAYFASVFGLAAEALFPAVRAGPALVALLPLAIVLVPLVPVTRWLDRRGAVALAAAATALFRLPMTHPALEARLLGGALVLASAFAFLLWAVGYLDRRAVAAGAVLGLVADQLLRLAGTSYDVTLRPSWFPAQAVLTLLLVWLALSWSRQPEPGLDPARGSTRGEGMERRAGGLRSRGALALGALLFAELHVLGLASASARLTGVGYDVAALALIAAGAIALALAASAPRPAGNRGLTMGLTLALAVGLAVTLGVNGPIGIAGVAAGHLATLLLITRALEPASGRRGGGAVSAGMVVFILLTAAYALTFYHAFALPILASAAPWIFAVTALLVGGSFVLMPRPPETESPMRPAAAVGLAVAVFVAGLLLRVAAVALHPDPPPPPSVAAASGEEVSEVRVITWNLHYGFSGDWRFEPHEVAAALEREEPDLVALQEVPAGLPTAYGMDVALWLGSRLGLRTHFSPTVNGLLGDAFLERLPGARVGARPIPAAGGDPKQHLRLVAPTAAGTVSFHGLHLGVVEEARPIQLDAVLTGVDPGPAVVLGDLNEEAAGPVTRRLRAAGFRDVFEGTGPAQATWPADDPRVRIDWIWVRGLGVTTASTLADAPSDHRAVAATLHARD